MNRALDVLLTLLAGRMLISDRKDWTTHSYARTASGGTTFPCENDAVCWCAFGAVSAVSPTNPLTMACENALDRAADDLFGCHTVKVNDNYGHRGVMEIYDRAIAKLEASL